MKRDHTNSTEKGKLLGQESFSSGGSGSSSSSCRGKMWDECKFNQHDAGDDELLALLGYKVKSSSMEEVAQKIEQLEEFMGNVQENGLSQLSSETVHYNPSDLSSWLESMISELNPDGTSSTHDSSATTVTSLDNSCTTNAGIFNRSSSVVFEDSSFDCDLTAIPGKAVYPRSESKQQPATTAGLLKPEEVWAVEEQAPPKRMRPNDAQVGMWGVPSESIVTVSRPVGPAKPVEPIRPVVLVDSQDNGIRLVHALMACAEAIQQENLKVAEALVKQIGILAVSQAGAMRKVAIYFAEALARRIYRLFPTNRNDSAFTDLLQMHFYESCPYLKFAHFTANHAILEAFTGKSRVHVIDFSLKQGMQWPALLQALATRPGGPPRFRLTGIGRPSQDNTDHLQEVGWKLAQLAETINVEFEFRDCVVNSLADLDASMFDVCEDETVVVNSIFELHQLLAPPGAIEKVLSVVRELKPEILTVVEQEANHNGPVFLDRFTESLHYYSTLFDSLEGCGGGGDTEGDGTVAVTHQDKVMSELYLGRQICNVVACEGLDRIERHETLAQWRTRFNSAGLKPVFLGSNAFKEASMLLAVFAVGDGYMVEENNGCLMLGWQTRPLIATSAWKLG